MPQLFIDLIEVMNFMKTNSIYYQEIEFIRDLLLKSFGLPKNLKHSELIAQIMPILENSEFGF